MSRACPSRRTAGRASAALVAMCLALAAAAQPAAADCDLVYKYVPYPPYSDLVLECDASDDGPGSSEPAPKPKPKPKPKPPTRAELRQLLYKPSRAVSTRVQDDLIGRLASGESATQIEALIRSGDLVRQPTRQLREFGWSTRDLGDRYAQAYVVMWIVVNGGDTSARVNEAVRKDLRTELASRKLRRWGDARQQTYAERLSSWTTVIAGSLNTLQRSGDVGAVREWRADARTLAEERYLLGVDLTTVRLTKRGVVRR